MQLREVAEQRRVEHAGEAVAAEVEHLEPPQRGEAGRHLTLDVVAAEVERREGGEHGELVGERTPEPRGAEVERHEQRAPRQLQRDGLVEGVRREAERRQPRHPAQRLGGDVPESPRPCSDRPTATPPPPPPAVQVTCDQLQYGVERDHVDRAPDGSFREDLKLSSSSCGCIGIAATAGAAAEAAFDGVARSNTAEKRRRLAAAAVVAMDGAEVQGKKASGVS